jgi:serine phosphatase RsbU (regulator of sigma subunit)
LGANSGASSADIVRSVAEAVRDFVAGALPSDDITMLALRRVDARSQ